MEPATVRVQVRAALEVQHPAQWVELSQAVSEVEHPAHRAGESLARLAEQHPAHWAGQSPAAAQACLGPLDHDLVGLESLGLGLEVITVVPCQAFPVVSL